MIDPIVWILIASAGLSIIVTKSYIFEGLRDLFDWDNAYKVNHIFSPAAIQKIEKLLNCPLCFGFWAFFIVFGISLIPLIGIYIVYALCASILSLITYSII